MTDTDRERLRATFGEAAELYHRARPDYPAALFRDLTRLAGLTPRSRVLELGCGTGQATAPLARLGCTVVAVELSPALAAVARETLRAFPNVRVDVGAFEEWTPPEEPFDLVLAATSFHWIDPEVRVRKPAALLRPGGSLAVVATDHVAGGTERFFADVQGCYERFDPATPPGLRQTPGAAILDEPFEAEPDLFGPPHFRRYEWDRAYTTAQYLDLLMTYSGHRALPAPARDGLLACVAGLIDGEHGGRIVKRYQTRLTVAQVR